MTTVLITNGVWQKLTRAARDCNGAAYAAVPYFSAAGSRLLPLKRGDILVVNASDAAVASGQTCPSALRRLMNKGVKVYSLQNLHAKVFVFGRTAYVGSANVSTSSKEQLVEAVTAVRDQKTVAAAKNFVAGLCEHRITHTELDRLAAIYRPPRARPGKRTTRTKRQPRLWISNIAYQELDAELEQKCVAGRASAKKKRSGRQYAIDEFWYPGEKDFAVGDAVIQIYTYDDGVTELFPPATVINRLVVRRNVRRMTFVYLETLAERGIPLAKAKSSLGRGVSRRLERDGPLGRGAVRDRLIAYLATHT